MRTDVWTNSSKASVASVWAAMAHRYQKRKYTHEPYLCHLADVAANVAHYAELSGDETRDEALAAAYLHDVIEDQGDQVSLGEIESEFGANVARVVSELTEVPTEGNRAERKSKEARRLSGVGFVAREIKAADFLSNGQSIFSQDPKFGLVFAKEVTEVLDLWKEMGYEETALVYMVRDMIEDASPGA